MEFISQLLLKPLPHFHIALQWVLVEHVNCSLEPSASKFVNGSYRLCVIIFPDFSNRVTFGDGNEREGKSGACRGW